MATVPDDPSVELPLIIHHPIQISGVARVDPKGAPGLGEHADEILREIGYDERRIAELRDKGVI